MSEQIISDHQLISINQLVRALREGRSNSERFCFIIGSGASVSSGIPAGAALEYQWMEEMEKSSGLEEIRDLAKTLGKHLEYDFEKIEQDWERAKKSGGSLSSEYYFDIYKLRFFPNQRTIARLSLSLTKQSNWIQRMRQPIIIGDMRISV